jgi:predicted dehydrogenase
MEVELELTGGVTGRMTCSMKKDAQLGASFIARGERGELKVTNPVGPHWGNQLTLKVDGDEKSESVSGETTFTYQLSAFVKAVRGEAEFPTDAAEAIVNMQLIDDVYRAAGLPPRAGPERIARTLWRK